MSVPIKSSCDSPTNSLESRLNAHPALKVKIESLLSVVENVDGELQSAHEAEQRVIEEIQKLGQTALQGWAIQQNENQRETFVKANTQAHRSRKKHSTGILDSVKSGLKNKRLRPAKKDG